MCRQFILARDAASSKRPLLSVDVSICVSVTVTVCVYPCGTFNHTLSQNIVTY